MLRYIALLVLVLSFSFCKEKKPADDRTNKAKYTFPDTVDVSHPSVALLDTCAKPYVMEIPEKGERTYTIAYKKNTEVIKINPPKISPLSGWQSGEYTFGVDYNYDQSLTLTGISCGYSDRLGNLWFGTFGAGISRYDGSGVTNFTTAQNLAGNLIKSIKEDREGNLWFGTNGNGISKYDGKKFTVYTTADGLAGNIVRSILVDSAGNVWFCTDGGISMYSASTGYAKKIQFVNYSTEQGLVNNIVLSSLADKSGNLWFGTKEGLSKGIIINDRLEFKNYTTSDGLIGNSITAISEDKNGDIWFGTAGNGVSKYEPGSTDKHNGPLFINFTEKEGLVNGNIQSMNTDAEGNVWFATGDGISRFAGIEKGKPGSKGTFINYSTKNDLVSNTVHSITKDRNDNLWFGTASNGLNKFVNTPLTTITSKHGLESEKVWSMCEDEKGNLWIATGYGVTKYDGSSFSSIAANYLTSTVRAIIKDNKGNVWWGSFWGLSKFDGKTVTTIGEAQGITEAVLCLVEDKKGNIWFGTYGQGLMKYDGKTLTNYTTAHGLSNNGVKCIIEDKEGNIWVGTNGGGVCRFDGKQFISYKKEQGLANNTVLSCIQDGNGNLWFGTGGGGISRLINNTRIDQSGCFKNYTTTDGLPNDIVFAIAEDTVHNKIWFGTNLGIAALDKDSVASVNSNINFEIYNKNNGYPIRDLNTGALYVDKKGIIWAGTGEKFVRFDYGAIRRSLRPPVVVLKGVKILEEPVIWSGLKYWQESKGANYLSEKDSGASFVVLNEEAITLGKPLADNQRIKVYEKFESLKFDSITPFYPIPLNLVLPNRYNHVTFEFAAIETGKPKLVRYQFMLEGYDKTWRPVTVKASADYGNINEGTYTFKLKAQSPDGVWSEPIAYTFKVLPPWYLTWWMYFVYSITILVTIVLLFRWRTTALRKDKELLELTVKQRTSEVIEQKKLVEKKNELIEEKQKEIVDSINYAKRIQYALLAHEEVLKNHLKSHFVFFQPKDIVSGDFYWATEVHEHAAIASSVFYLAVCDSTGHGVPGAFMSLLNISFLNEAINEKNIRKPNEILNHVRQRLIENISQDGAQDGMDGILLCFEYSSLDDQNATIEKNVKITYAAANNAPLLIRDNVLTQLPYDRMPVGKGEKMQSFTLYSLDVVKDDTIYCCTDGYADQFGGPKGKKFKTKQLNELLVSIHEKSIKKQKQLLGTTIENWKTWSTFSGQPVNIQEQVDDILIIGFKID